MTPRGFRHVLFLGALAAAVVAAAPAGAVVPHEVAIAHGIELITSGNYRAALAPLDEALAADPGNAEALFYAGVARSRLGRYRDAEDLLRLALAEAESVEVYYELGRVAALTGRCDDAERLFARLTALAAGGVGPADTAALLADCRGGRRRTLHASLSLGWQHDSNVVLDPDNPVVPRDRVADSRLLALLGAGGTLLRAGDFELDGRYSFYGSLHANIDDYNALYHKLAPTLAWAGSDAVRPSLGYTFESTSFGGDPYGIVHTGFVRLLVPEGEGIATEVSAELRGNRFSSSELFPDNDERRGTGWSARLAQGVERGALDVRVFVAHERDDARAGWWDAQGWRVGGRVGWRPVPELALGANAEYRAVDYDDPGPAGGAAREDRVTEVGAALSWSPWRHGSVTLTASHTRDDSNLDAYTYQRTIYGFVVTLGI